jgi:hypothetical protein
MATITPNKSVNVLLPITVTGLTFKLDLVDLSNIVSSLLCVRFGRCDASASTVGVTIRVEIGLRPDAEMVGSPAYAWIPLTTFTTGFAACEAEPVVSVTGAYFYVASTTNLTTGETVFLKHPTPELSEFAKIYGVGANYILLEETPKNDHSQSTIYDSAELFIPIEIPIGASHLRVVFEGAAFARYYAAEVVLLTTDSFTSI